MPFQDRSDVKDAISEEQVHQGCAIFNRERGNDSLRLFLSMCQVRREVGVLLFEP